jgi:YteA family regulatory protein
MNELNEQQKKELYHLLILDQEDTMVQLQSTDHFGQEQSLRESVGELSLYDNHPGDLGSDMFERGKDLALNEKTEHHRQEIQEALIAMKDGTYGNCKVCGKPIPFERLQAVPHTLYCIEHVPHSNDMNSRPIEETIMTDSLERFQENEHIDHPSPADESDAWQIVADWGNSNTPALSADPYFHDDDDYIHEDDNGYVENIEAFLATDIYGNGQNVLVYPSSAQYQSYVDHDEGDNRLMIEADDEY